MVAERDGLALQTILGDMADLSQWAPESFDLIVHPASNLFVPDVRRVFRVAYRVLRGGGVMLYSDVTSLSDEARKRYTDPGEPLAFGHTLEDQIGGQTNAGFVITGFYGDKQVGDDVISRFMPCFGAIRAVKPTWP
jgi:SAM-dependent methyltransferase